MNKRSIYIAQFYRRNKLRFFLAALSALLTAGMNLAIAWVLQQMLDTVSGVSGALSLPVLAILLAGLIALIFAIKGLQYISRPSFIQKAMEQYKDYAFQKLAQKSIAAFRTESTARYISAFSNDAAAIETGYLETQFDLLANLASFFGSLAMMLAYSPMLTVLSCMFFLLPIGISLATKDWMEKAERQVSEQNGAFVAALQDSLNGFSVIKSFQAEQAIAALFSKSNQAAEQAKCEKRKQGVAISALAGAAGVAAQFGTLLAGAWLALAGRGVTPGMLIVFVDLTASVIGPVQQFPQQFAARKAALGLIDKLADALDSHVREQGAPIPSCLHQGIAISHLSFGYEPGAAVLQDLTFRFEAGKSYAIVGASGSGKSTLLHLLMASDNRYTGQICYDGREIQTIRSDSLYNLVSIIQQDVFVFNASIRDNITMFHKFSDREVDRAIALSGLSELIARRGDSYLCGENGSGLSGGEKQRISIARSLLKHAQVLLVDEATAALDAATARQVSASILGLDGTIRIVVTHALDAALLRQYDCILALKNGRIQESGTFEELMDQKKYFYSLFTVSQ